MIKLGYCVFGPFFILPFSLEVFICLYILPCLPTSSCAAFSVLSFQGYGGKSSWNHKISLGLLCFTRMCECSADALRHLSSHSSYVFVHFHLKVRAFWGMGSPRNTKLFTYVSDTLNYERVKSWLPKVFYKGIDLLRNLPFCRKWACMHLLEFFILPTRFKNSVGLYGGKIWFIWWNMAFLMPYFRMMFIFGSRFLFGLKNMKNCLLESQFQVPPFFMIPIYSKDWNICKWFFKAISMINQVK